MDRVNRARQELANTRGKLAEVKISIRDAEIILEAAIAEGERLQKEMDDNKAAQAKNLELRKFTANLHEVAVEEEKTANEIETRALCLERDLKYVAKFSRLTDRRYFLQNHVHITYVLLSCFLGHFRFKQVLEGTDALMNYISDDKLKSMVKEDKDKHLVSIAQSNLKLMQGVSMVSRAAEKGIVFDWKKVLVTNCLLLFWFCISR